ncbi:Putative FAD-binding domain, phenol hydroxylase dimerization domain, Thioredoxin-like superfamily [Septoria linicola]|uniref:FAD-binding domain, phenol hydroxylase dimerization domain, Thioredoxin-like superfamily n=1 Tax=Septoria linicola TaxID=215465 RepID=A0A9Q9EFF3_9PEZI|nr:Putative FAD-binding domain, phenol hydroxylase dimerization domain, Thioredoxin-like superfamily [Septoria linicola]
MQFHLNGFQGSRDPNITQFVASQEPDFQSSLPGEVDVLIIGAGPAGQLLGAQLAQFPDITTRIIETKPGRLEQGQADGLQCRTIEIFEAFGFSERVLKEAYWVNETTFWSPTENGDGLRRSGRIRDTEEGLSEFPHVILNQARLHDLWLDAMKWSPTRLEPSYSRKMVDLLIPEGTEPCKVTLERLDEAHRGEKEVVSAKYVIGCDGARSGVRRTLGLEMKGDYQNQAWGVMDALVVTDFPDARLKTVIHSADQGSILIIPREGGYLTRLYIELDKVNEGARMDRSAATAETLTERAKSIFAPYTFDVKQIAYWSVYEVGQRLTDHFDDVPKDEQNLRDPRVLITGDACHTHSAKAGQGMNVSMNDSFNLGWKLAHVLRGQAPPKLLHSYSAERQEIAQTLINFDREMSRMFAAKPKTKAGKDDQDFVDPAVFQDNFQRQGRFMAGVETKYRPGPLISSNTEYQHLATGFQIGTRFQSVQVLRVADAKPVQLSHNVLKADGRWRIIIFGDKSSPTSPSSPVAGICDFIEHHLIPDFTRPGADLDSVIDVRAVFQQSRQTFEITDLPSLLVPLKGKLTIRDYEKAFTDEPSYGFGSGEIYKTRGIDAKRGCVIMVRPDQYVSAVFPLAEEAKTLLDDFFAGFLYRMKSGVNGGR